MSVIATAAIGCTGPAGSTGAPGPQGPGGPGGSGGTAPDAGNVIGTVDDLQLPGAGFFPYSINAGADGAIYVGSPTTGEVVKYERSSLAPTTVIPASSSTGGVNGILVDDANGVLYTCTNVFTSQSTANAVVRSYDLAGNAKQSYPLPNQGASLCEELAFDASHDLYAVDAWGGAVYVMPAAGSAFATWVQDPLLQPTSPDAIPFGARGILIAGSDVYVTNFNTGALVHVPVGADGTAGTPTAVTVTPALTNPESIRALDAQHLVVVEDVWESPDGLVSELAVSGASADKTVLANNLLGPSCLVVSGGNIWVPLGEVWHTLDGSAPDSLPFQVARFTAE